MAGIYIHIPFCRHICSYCDFYSTASSAMRKPMLEALLYELELRRDYLGDEPVKTLYIGGGTPTVYRPHELQRLADKVKELWRVSDFREFTVEANPEDLTPDYIAALRDTDAGRLSIGIQSFADEHLAFMRRGHTAEQAIRAVKDAVRAGFSDISIDLIYAVPGMSPAQWRDNIRRAFSLGVQHISAYHLTIEEHTLLGNRAKRGLFEPVADSVSREHYDILEEEMDKAGFIHYEVSNFASGERFMALHNTNYWKGIPYLGAGPSAHSYNLVSRQWNVASNKLYLESLYGGGSFYEKEELSLQDRYNEYVMTALRTMWGADTDTVRKRFSPAMADYLEKQAAPFVKQGMLVSGGSRLYIPSGQFLISDYIISHLFI